FRKDVKKDFMGKAAKKEAGKRLMKEYDCGACHKFKDEPGRTRYPDLTHEGRKRDKKWLANWLKNPNAVKPDAYMPEFPFTDKERATVAEYLSSLK
ncbi:MAG: cytochrome c, partial [Deltaproteobacteria bacterium]|nr:cytochrome c [Deltaproteobacteria bacterium]